MPSQVDWSEEKPTLELLKSTVTVEDVLGMLGIEVNANGKFALRDERTPSAAAYSDHYWDYGTGTGGDIIDIVRHFDPELTVGQAIRKIWFRALRSGREPGDVEREAPRHLVDFSSQFIMAYPVCPVTFRATWASRLGVEVPIKCRGDSNTLLIPHCDAEGIYGVKVRTSDGTKSAWPGSAFTKRLYDPLGWPNRDGWDTCIITEGESDCWALTPLVDPHPVFALPSGAGAWKDAWLSDLEPFKTIYVVTDNDKAGKAARDKLERKIGVMRVEHLFVPQLYNDAREAITAGWRPSLSVG